ncbi:hypothetical protein K3495_g11775 [Podosphaera aphanis]|nr:hypothetical protein K3495_g11775 [Podosphaera aphanis]
MSTAFHPDTDGSTERRNQEVLAYLRAFISYSQYEWPSMLLSAMLALNNRDTTIGLSPFFLSHGCHAEPVQQFRISTKPRSKLEERAHDIVKRLVEAQEYAQAAMATAQQRMESYANLIKRQPQERYKKGDLVWLNLQHISTPQLSKKLSWVNSKYRVTEVISPHVEKFDVASEIWPSSTSNF